MAYGEFGGIILGIGSNRGDSRRIVLEAVKSLSRILECLRSASLYETAPLHVTDQGNFINTAVSGFFSKSPRELLSAVQAIEAAFGRDRKNERRWGERFLDIDILLFDGIVLDEANLVIPHPRLKERRFALEPLLELVPDAAEPYSLLSYREICAALPCQGVRKIAAS